MICEIRGMCTDMHKHSLLLMICTNADKTHILSGHLKYEIDYEIQFTVLYLQSLLGMEFREETFIFISFQVATKILMD